MAVSFIDEGNQNIQRKPQTCPNLPKNFRNQQ
jgi:hypothetical protein